MSSLRSTVTGGATLISGGAGTGDLLAANNLSDVDDAATALGNLGGLALTGGTLTGPLVVEQDAAIWGSFSGVELLTNNDFATDLTGWAGTGWSWEAGTDGQARHTAGNTDPLSATVALTAGTVYSLIMNQTGRTAGSWSVLVDGVDVFAGNTFSFNGTSPWTFVAPSTGSVTLAFVPTSDYNGAMKSVSVQAVIPGAASTALTFGDGFGTSDVTLRTDGTRTNLLIGGGGAGIVHSSTYANVTVSNTALGTGALGKLGHGGNNTAIGTDTLAALGYGQQNTVVGSKALDAATFAQTSAVVGYNALGALTGGVQNTAMGSSSGGRLVTGDANVLIGYAAGQGAIGATGVDQNTVIGANAGLGLITGQTGCVFIGFEAGYSETASNKLHIANNQTTSLITGDFSTGEVGFQGDVTVGGSLTITDTQLTGWASPTGSVARSTFDTATATLTEVAQRLAALITDLTSRGDLAA